MGESLMGRHFTLAKPK